MHILLVFGSILITFQGVQSQEVGTVCKDQRLFYCYNSTHFQLCTVNNFNVAETFQTVTYPCPNGTRCDNADRYECSVQDTFEGIVAYAIDAPDSNNTATPKFTCTEEGLFADKTDCRSFFACVKQGDGFTVTHNGCRYGAAFDPALQRCTNDQTACYTDFKCTEPGKFADPANPSYYYWCLSDGVGYTIYHMECENGQKFDVTLEDCK
ncbi:uncharacterized protein LOC134214648 [Armigeres subalbatus]|uniref:uncharacterized protein LOC134214648 n=1 Tax=Armigeres subalbatus TaxID=124917 RepID=UPI002ED09121